MVPIIIPNSYYNKILDQNFEIKILICWMATSSYVPEATTFLHGCVSVGECMACRDESRIDYMNFSSCSPVMLIT